MSSPAAGSGLQANPVPAGGSAAAALEVRDLRVRAGAPGLNEVVRQGEILGVAGLDGNGQEEFLEVLVGLRKPVAGTVMVTDRRGAARAVRSFHGAARAGVVYLPRDRKSQGILPALSILDNFGLPTLGRSATLGFLRRRHLAARYMDFHRRLSIVAASPNAPITSLSGGNQQKVLLARWMAADPRVIVLNDPTRGVDLATRLALYDVFRDLARDGKALVLLSTEIEELLRVCHRTLVFREGYVFAALAPPAMTMAAIIAAMFGRTDEQ